MDPTRFDALAKALGSPASRRAAFRLIAALVALRGRAAAAARCKKPCGECGRCKKGKCKPAKDGTACGTGPTRQKGRCACPSGHVRCPDGRACDVTCSGPNGDDYCCDASRPVAICGGCWHAGSTACTVDHCCGPDLDCCGGTHCCADGWQCVLGCGPERNTATCCRGGQSPRCCPEGTPG
jgi:hypothetical protein